MRCDVARDLLLEADRRELLDGSTSALGRHLATCDGCARAAALLRRADEELGSLLAAEAPSLDVVEGILRRAVAEDRDPRRPRGGNALPTWGRFAALASAAAVATLLLVRGGGELDPGVGPLPAGDPPTVEEYGGRSVAVMPTDNPDITVLWYF